MLSVRQSGACSALAILFWLVATLALHFWPGLISGSVNGPLAFITSIPIGWACIRLTRRVARLQASHLAAGCLLVVAITTCIDGAALRFLPHLYAADERTCRLAAAWLLWGYGVSGFAALLMGWRAAPVTTPMGG
jgi:hypothetical protein